MKHAVHLTIALTVVYLSSIALLAPFQFLMETQKAFIIVGPKVRSSSIRHYTHTNVTNQFFVIFSMLANNA